MLRLNYGGKIYLRIVTILFLFNSDIEKFMINGSMKVTFKLSV